MPVLILGITEEPVVIDLHLAVLVAVLDSQLYILAQVLAFLLGETRP